MNAHPLPRARWPLATPPHHLRGLRRLVVVGCSTLILAALMGGPAPAVAADPAAGPAHAGTQSTKSRTGTAPAKAKAAPAKTTTDASAKSKPKTAAAKSKSKTEAAKSKPSTKTTEAAKRQPRRPSVGHAANPAPLVAFGPDLGQSTANRAVFEHGPGVLGISLRTLRQQQIREYVTEPVALVALALDDLRLGPVNKGTHVEVNLGDRIPFDGKGDKVSPKSRRLLDVIARILTDNPQTRIQVLVHTDGTGEAGANLAQSQRAAEAVKAYLMAKGIAATRISAIGRGDETPLVATGKRTATWRERNRNRRVELIVEPLQPVAAALPPPPAAPIPAPLNDQAAPPIPVTPTD